MAKEMMEQTKNSILTQAAQAMLAQANQQPQGVLQLLTLILEYFKGTLVLLGSPFLYRNSRKLFERGLLMDKDQQEHKRFLEEQIEWCKEARWYLSRNRG